jgi:hypothetical protein
MQNTDFGPRSSEDEKARRSAFVELFNNSPIARSDLVYSQLSLYMPRQELSRMLFLSDLYRQHVLETNGILVEFGTCYGRTASILTNLRAIFEPFNFTRRLAIFDTFTGLQGVEAVDGSDRLASDGAYSAGDGYEKHLGAVLDYHESEAPISHIRKFEIIKGDATQTTPAYFASHPEAIIALAFFDFDIYRPTKACLEAIRPHLTKGSVLVFDQLNCPGYPGETVALSEMVGLNNVKIRRSPLTPWISYVLCEDFL